MESSSPSTSDPDSSEDEHTVLHGLAARQHAVYGIDMMVLQVLRAVKQHGLQFYLAANLAGIGQFGDLLIANVTQSGMSQVLLVYICPQDSKSVSLKALSSACQAYLKLKRTLHQREDLNFLSMSLSDFRFVIYSTADTEEDFPSLSYINESDGCMDMLNTSSSHQPYCCDVYNCPEVVSEPELYSELKVIILIKQANMDELEKCLLAEIESLQLSRSAYARHFLLLRLKDQMKDWWKAKNQYMTGDEAQQLINDAWRYTSKTFAMNADEVCRREANIVQESLESCVACKQSVVIMECSPGSESLVVLLLCKILGEKLLMAKLSNLQRNMDEILAAWTKTLLILEEEQNITTSNQKGIRMLCEELKRATLSSERHLMILSSLTSCKLSREMMANLTDEKYYVCHVYKRLDFEKYMEHLERELFQKMNDNICSTLEQQSLHFSQRIQTIMKDFNNAIPFEGSGEENLNVVAVKEQLLKDMFMLMKQRAENKLQGKLREEAITVLTELGTHLFQLGLPVQSDDVHNFTFHKPLRNDGYGAKLAALLFLRCIARQQHFQLGAKMSAAGRFGDLVLRVCSTGDEGALNTTYLVQLRCHEGIRAHGSLDTERMCLQSIYNSYCALKENWANSKDLQNCGEFSECVVVIYTDNVVDVRRCHHPDEKFSLLNTCGTCFTITEEMFPELYQEWKQHKEFLAQLWFLTEQAELGYLSKLLEQEVAALLCASAAKSQEIASVMETHLCNWWLLSKNFITPNEFFWSKTVKPLVLNLSLSGDKLLEKLHRVTFKNQYLGTLKNILAKPFKCLHIITKSPSLSAMKVLQLLSGMPYVLLTSDSLLSQSEQVYSLWMLPGSFRHVVLILLGTVDLDEQAIQLIKTKGIPKDGKVIIVSSKPIPNNLDSVIVHEDHTKMLFLDEYSATKVISSGVYFQGKNAILGEIFNSSKFPKHKLGEEILQEALAGKEIHIGISLTPCRHTSHYIPRSLGVIQNDMDHIKLVRDVWLYPRKWVVILGDTGSGKTTFLIEFANVIQKVSPYTWVIIATFADFINAPHPRDVIMKKAGACDGLGAMLLSHELQRNGNVALLIDGLDEVEPHHLDEGLHSLKLAKKELKLAKVIILARPVLKKTLQRAISAQSLQLLSFTVQEQKLFLVKYWQTKCKNNTCTDMFNCLAERLLELLQQYIPDPQNNLTGTPFFMHILADLYQEKANHPPTVLDVFQICKTFLNRRLGVFMQKKTSRDVSSLMFQAEKLYTYYALKTVRNLPQMFVPDALLKKFLLTVRYGSEIYGIICEKNGHIVFIHNVFKEYYSGVWFGSQFNDFRTFLESQMFENEFQGIRAMMDRFLCQEFEIHTAVLLDDIAMLENLCSYNINAQDWGGRTPLHLVRNKGIAQILLQNGATKDLKDSVMNWTPFQYVSWLNYM